MILMAVGLRVHGRGRAPQRPRRAGEPNWLVAAYTFHTFAELCLSPIGLSFVSKLAPLKYTSLLMGVWFFGTAIAEFLAGQLAAFTDRIARGELFHFLGGQADFFLIFVARRCSAPSCWRRSRPGSSAGCTGGTSERRESVRRSSPRSGLLLSSAVSAGSPQPDDPYRWLEDGDAPAVARWTEAAERARRARRSR